MTYLAPALAGHGSVRFQSCGAEIGLALTAYAGAVSSPSPLTEAASLRALVLGSRRLGVVEGPRDLGRAAGRMGGDLSARGARSRQWGQESRRQPGGESGRMERTH